MFGFGKKQDEFEIIVMNGKEREVVGKEHSLKEAIAHTNRLRKEHKMAIYKRC